MSASMMARKEAERKRRAKRAEEMGDISGTV